jgi:hypothetical protein
MPEKTLLSILPFSSLITACWINEMASNLVLFIAGFNLGNEKSQLVLNQGSMVDGIKWGCLVSPKTWIKYTLHI